MNFKNYTGATCLISAFIVSYMPAAIADSGIFDEAEKKGDELINDFIDGPARIAAFGAIVAAVLMFFFGKLPIKWLILIVSGALLLGSADTILNYLMD